MYSSGVAGEFVLAMPQFTVASEGPSGAARIVLKSGTQILAQVSDSPNPPSVTLISPNGGENWSGEKECGCEIFQHVSLLSLPGAYFSLNFMTICTASQITPRIGRRSDAPCDTSASEGSHHGDATAPVAMTVVVRSNIGSKSPAPISRGPWGRQETRLHWP